MKMIHITLLLIPILFVACFGSGTKYLPSVGGITGNVGEARTLIKTIRVSDPASAAALVDATSKLDQVMTDTAKLQGEIRKLGDQAAQVPDLQAAAAKKDKRIWQLWTVIIGAVVLVGGAIGLKLWLKL